MQFEMLVMLNIFFKFSDNDAITLLITFLHYVQLYEKDNIFTVYEKNSYSTNILYEKTTPVPDYKDISLNKFTF